jgi:hypothetical protein
MLTSEQPTARKSEKRKRDQSSEETKRARRKLSFDVVEEVGAGVVIETSSGGV